MNQETPEILSRRQTAAFLGIGLNTLARLADLPRTRIGHRVMFQKAIIQKWLDQHTAPKAGANA